MNKRLLTALMLSAAMATGATAGAEPSALENALNDSNVTKFMMPADQSVSADLPLLEDREFYINDYATPTSANYFNITGNGHSGFKGTDYTYYFLTNTNTVSGFNSTGNGGAFSTDKDAGLTINSFIYDGDKNPLMTTITGNTATGKGGGIYADFDWGGAVTLVNTNITNNIAGDKGGGLYVEYGSTLIQSLPGTNVDITGNKAVIDGQLVDNDIYLKSFRDDSSSARGLLKIYASSTASDPLSPNPTGPSSINIGDLRAEGSNEIRIISGHTNTAAGEVYIGNLVLDNNAQLSTQHVAKEAQTEIQIDNLTMTRDSILNTVNGYIDENLAILNVNLDNSNNKFFVEASLIDGATAIDNLVFVNGGTAKLNVKIIDANTTSGSVRLFTMGNATILGTTTQYGTDKYTFTQDAVDKGVIHYVATKDSLSLQDALYDMSIPYYDMPETYVATSNLGYLRYDPEVSTRVFTIYGKGDSDPAAAHDPAFLMADTEYSGIEREGISIYAPDPQDPGLARGSKLIIKDLDVFSGFVSKHTEGYMGHEGEGGAIHADQAVLDISNVKFIGNIASGDPALDTKRTAGNGGAIYINTWESGPNGTKTEIKDSAFLSNEAVGYGPDTGFVPSSGITGGGAIYSQGNIDISDTLFSDNLSKTMVNANTVEAGAIYISNTADKASISGSMFLNNIAGEVINATTPLKNTTASGGAIYSRKANLDINDTSFISNYAQGAGDRESEFNPGVFITAESRGGAIYVDPELNSGATNTININGSDFMMNKAISVKSVLDGVSGEYSLTSDGVDQTKSYGGAIALMPTNKITVNIGDSLTEEDKHSTFVGNQSGLGGAIYNYVADINIKNATFTDNKATNGGGAIYNGRFSSNKTGVLNIDGTTFARNVADDYKNDIENNGVLNFVGKGSTLDGGISGYHYGTTNFNLDTNEEMTMTAGTTIAQKEIYINSGIINSNAGVFYARDKFTNNATLNVTGGSFLPTEDEAEIINNGTMTGYIDNWNNMTNNGTITGNIHTVSSFSNTGTITGDIENFGTGEVANSGTITGNVDNKGVFNNTGSVTGNLTTTGDVYTKLNDISGTITLGSGFGHLNLTDTNLTFDDSNKSKIQGSSGSLYLANNVVSDTVLDFTGEVYLKGGRVTLGENGDLFTSASKFGVREGEGTINMMNGSVDNLDYGSNKLVMQSGTKLNVEMDWGDNITATSGYVLADAILNISKLDISTTDSGEEYAFAANQKNIVSVANTDLITAAGKANSIAYNNSTGVLSTLSTTLADIITASATAADEEAYYNYSMLNDEAGNSANSVIGNLKVLGNGNSIITDGLSIGTNAKTGEVILKDINVTGMNNTAITVNNGNLFLQSEALPAITFSNNTSAGTGGAILNKGNASTVAQSAVIFSGNSADMGGAVHNLHGNMVFNELATFDSNSATGEGKGGALSNLSGRIQFLNGATFTNNTSSSSGSAVYNALNHEVEGIIDFTGDVLVQGNTSTSNEYAIHNLMNDNVDNTITFSNGNATFKNNVGGAIWNQDLMTFTNMGDVIFEGNSITGNKASAISNVGTLTMGADNVLFKNNTSSKGAIWNSSVGSVLDITANTVTFENNLGGAIYKENDNLTITATNAGGTGTITFVNNNGDTAAALNNNGNTSNSTLTADKIVFDSNTSATSYGGAIFNSGTMIKLLSKDILFKNNEANGTTSTESNKIKYGGGAIQNRGNINTSVIIGKEDGTTPEDVADYNVTFENNYSAMHGGAIHARAEGNTNVGAVTINANATFTGNEASLNGGAISNSPVNGTSTVSIIGNSTFTNNKAGGLGGAIYNTGTVNLNGSTFSGNTANGVANDIYNDGTAAFNYENTLEGGITGNGTTDITSGSTLTTANIEQDNVSLSGTLKADAATIGTISFDSAAGTIDAKDGKIVTYNAGTIIGGAGNMKLDVDLTGENPVSDAINITTGGNNIVITVTDLGVNGTLSDFTVDVLKGSIDGASIALSDDVQNEYNYTGEWENKEHSDVITQTATWDDQFKTITWEQREVKAIAVEDSTKIKYTDSTEKRNEETVIHETITMLNQATQFGTEERKFVTDDPNKNHVVTEDFGTTAAGTMTIQGASDGENMSKIFMTTHNGFTVGEGSTLNLDTVAFRTIATEDEGSFINNTAGTVNMNKVDVSTSIYDVIANNSVMNIQDSDIRAAISGTGTTNVYGDSIIYDITQNTINIAPDAKLSTKYITATEGINNEGELTFTADTTNTSKITGNGTVVIDADVINNANIEAAVAVNSGKSLTSSADNIKNTVANSGTYTVTDGTITNAVTGNGSMVVDGNVASTAPIANNVTVNSGKSLSADASNLGGTVANNGTLNVGDGTLNNAISGTGNVNITGNVVNNATNTTTGTVTIAEGKTLSLGPNSNDMFGSASALVLNDGVTLNTQNGTTTATAINNLVIGDGANVNAMTKWGDTLNGTLAGSTGSISVKSVDVKGTNGVPGAAPDSYALTNLGSNLNFAEGMKLENVGPTTYNTLTYNAATGTIFGQKNKLVDAIQNTDAGERTTYAMTGNETGGGSVLEGVLTIQGNGQTIQSDGTSPTGSDSIVIGNGTTAGADLIMEDVNLGNIATGGKEASVVVKGGNSLEFKAANNDVSIKGSDNKTGIFLQKDDTLGASTVTLNAEGGTIEIGDDIKSSSVDNIINFNGAKGINFSGTFDPATANVNTVLNRIGGYDEAITYNINLGGTVNYSKDSILYDPTHHTAAMMNTINFNGGTLNTMNGTVTDFNLANMSLSGTSNFYADVDLANRTMDKFTVANPVTGTGTLNVAGLNLISDSTTNKTTINFTTDPVLKASTSYTGPQGLTALSPLYRYNVDYDNSNGNFNFTKYGTGGYTDYNPAVYSSSVAAQGIFLSQLNNYDTAFGNLDHTMLMTQEQRQALRLRNSYASNDESDPMVYSPLYTQNQTRGLWFRPYTSFEKVKLENGPDVNNISYGMLVGGDTDMIQIGKNGWEGQISIYTGYNGSHQTFDGNGIYQNGGILGTTAALYKGNFFTALTANVGMSASDIKTIYGSTDMTTISTGIASKTGYNWELCHGKLILQPSWTMSYTFVGPLNNSTLNNGVRLENSPLHAIQLAPGLKIIGNLKNGWQPYLGVNMRWNILDKTNVKANFENIPETSVKPYIEYGLGVQKTIGDRFTGFGQAMFRSGGRNGVAFTFGFRWALGKEPAPVKKISNTRNYVTAPSTGNRQFDRKPEVRKTDVVLNSHRLE